MADDRFLKLVGKRIKQIRQAGKLTQEEAARKSGFDYKYYQRIEYGEKNLSLSSLKKLAKALGVSPSELINID